MTMKSLWKEKKSTNFTFFCPLCRATRVAAHRTNPTAGHYARVGLTSLSLTAATWPWFNWKGIVSFLPLWIGFETIYRLRARVSLACPHCGFDPYLYLIDIQKAKAEIENHWRRKFAEKGIPYPEKDVSMGRLVASSEGLSSPAPEGQKAT